MLKLSNKGFSLSELILAAAILAFAMAGILAIFVNCIFLNTSNTNLSIAAGHAQYALESVKNTNFTSIQSQAWDNTTVTSKGLTPLDSESIGINIDNSNPKVLNVATTVSWKDRGTRNRSFTLTTLIAEP